jgi:hypothetical protein
MSNFLVETKNEYTTHLINILNPLVFEGLQSIYKEAVDLAEEKENELLKIFQTCLKRIPKWNSAMIEKETNRIINSSHSYGWLNDLIKATLKANLIVLMYNPTLKVQNRIDPSFYQNIKTTDFIHRVYIECARELWNNPYLLYHHFPPIEIKRNQRDCMNIIKDCVKEALRKLLPVKHVLEFYLGEEIDNNLANDQFEKAMSDAEERNLTKLIQKDLALDRGVSNSVLPPSISKPEIEFNESQKMIQANITDTPKQKSYSNKSSESNDPTSSEMLQYPVKNSDKNVQKLSNTEEKTIGSRILNIINKKDSETSSLNSVMSSASEQAINKKISSAVRSNSSATSDDISAKKKSDEMSEIKQSIKGFEKALGPSKNDKPETFDDKIKKILQKDLATDSDLETSLNYSQEDNENKYQEIFSNSNITPKKDLKKDNKSSINKNKFFNNYLQF